MERGLRAYYSRHIGEGEESTNSVWRTRPKARFTVVERAHMTIAKRRRISSIFPLCLLLSLSLSLSLSHSLTHSLTESLKEADEESNKSFYDFLPTIPLGTDSALLIAFALLKPALQKLTELEITQFLGEEKCTMVRNVRSCDTP